MVAPFNKLSIRAAFWYNAIAFEAVKHRWTEGEGEGEGEGDALTGAKGKGMR